MLSVTLSNVRSTIAVFGILALAVFLSPQQCLGTVHDGEPGRHGA